jgi:hypothetical protein
MQPVTEAVIPLVASLFRTECLHDPQVQWWAIERIDQHSIAKSIEWKQEYIQIRIDRMCDFIQPA